MIKSLFDHDEEPKPQTPPQATVETEDAIRRELEQMNSAPKSAEKEPEIEQEVRQIFSKIIELPPEKPKAVEDLPVEFTPQSETPPEIQKVEPLDHRRFDEQPDATDSSLPLNQIFAHHIADETAHAEPSRVENTPPPPANEPPSFFQTNESQSLSTAETLRQSGLAWSAAIGLFGSVVFMLILGWIFDTLTGASPYGIIAGILIGAGVGFYQFFRVTSQIFKK
jgi:hypothetical protein